MKNVNDVNDKKTINTREEKKTLSYYPNILKNTVDTVDGKYSEIKKYNQKNINHYFITEIDDVIYWTESVFWRDFFVPKTSRQEIQPNKPPEKSMPANRETLLKARQQEKAYYENGYVYELQWIKVKGKTLRRGVWIKNEKRASEMLKKINNYKSKGGK